MYLKTIVQAGRGGRVFSRSQTCKKQVSLQLDSVPHIPTMKTFSTQGNCSVTVSDLDLLRILFHGDSISREYEARYPFNQKLGIIYTLHRGRKFSYSRFSETKT